MAFNPKTKRYSYTTGGEYTLSGNDYIGYFNVESKIARTGRSITAKSQVLSPTDRISVDMYQYEIHNSLIFPDRLIVDNILLPNNLEEIIIPPNEIVTSKIFNSHLTRLYENTIYLYSQLNIASNDIPNGYLYWVGLSGANPLSASEQKWNPSSLITINQGYRDAGYPQLDESKKSITVKSDDSESYISFSVSDTTLSVISSKTDKSKTSVVFSTSAIDLNSDKLFSNIADMSILDNRYLFVADSGNDAIYKYDISGYTISDVTISNKLFLVDVIGYQGDSKNKSGFSEPSVVESGAGKVYIYDKSNKCIKVYTSDFTWINTFVLSVDYDIIDLQYNNYHDVVFALVERSVSDFALLVFDNTIKNLLEEYDLDERYEEVVDGEVSRVTSTNKGRVTYTIDPREKLKGIRFSSQDSNIFYVFSNYTVYKKFISKPQATIGKWSITKSGIGWGYIWNFIDVNYNNLLVSWNTISGAGKENFEIVDMNIISREDNNDDIFMPAKSGIPDCFKILYFKESTLYDTALKSRDINIYNTTRLGTLEEEYVNAFTINKELYKQIFNILSIRNLLKGKFTGSYNKSGNLIYEQYDYITDEEMENILIGSVENLYVHENEIVSSEVLNRSLRKIYNLQFRILNLIKTRVKNITPTLALTGLNILRIE
jgi:hypothetical protein